MASDILQKALSVTTGGLTDFLPTPLAMQVIEYIRDVNVVRSLVKTIPMPGRTYTIPGQASGMSAYYSPDGTEAQLTSFTSTAITLTAKKMMAQVIIDQETLDDSQPDVMQLVLQDFGRAIGENEENAFLNGSTSHTATARTVADATSSNWFVGDPRVMFNGLFTLGDPSVNTSAATEVDAAGNEFAPTYVNLALYNLGKYGRNKGDMICLVGSADAGNLRNDSTFTAAYNSGLALSSAITGIDPGIAVSRGYLTAVFGVPTYEAPQAPAGYGLVFKRSSPVIGDRRAIKVVTGPIIQSDQTRVVISERIAFANQWGGAICRIKSLKTTIGT